MAINLQLKYNANKINKALIHYLMHSIGKILYVLRKYILVTVHYVIVSRQILDGLELKLELWHSNVIEKYWWLPIEESLSTKQQSFEESKS